MSQSVDLNKPADIPPALLTIDEVQRLIAQSREQFDEHRRPINIQINLPDSYDRMSRRRDEVGFKFFRSKLFLALAVFAVSAGFSYARTRYVCQSFKDEGRFFYGMGVDRCVGVLMKQPFEAVQTQLDLLNRSY